MVAVEWGAWRLREPAILVAWMLAQVALRGRVGRRCGRRWSALVGWPHRWAQRLLKRGRPYGLTRPTLAGETGHGSVLRARVARGEGQNGQGCDGVSAELDRAVRTVVRECMSVSPGEEVLVVCNPATEEIGALMRIEAQGDGADGDAGGDVRARIARPRSRRSVVAAAMAEADVVLAPTIQSLSHTAARKNGERGGGPHRHPARRHRRHADPADDRRPLRGAAARLGAQRHPQRRRRGAHHLPPRQRPADRARGPALDRRRRRTGQPRRLRQPALRRGLHRPGRGNRRGHARRRRLDRRNRPARHTDFADRPRRPPDRHDRLRRLGAAGDC